jgi:hypothetical protein
MRFALGGYHPSGNVEMAGSCRTQQSLIPGEGDGSQTCESSPGGVASAWQRGRISYFLRIDGFPRHR